MSPADWLVSSEWPWWRLVTFGPAGFGAYARLRFLPDPAFAGQRANDVQPSAGPPEDEQLRMLFDMLATHTTTPDDCYFCLWDGYGGIHGGAGISVVVASEDGEPQPAPVPEPAFGPDVLDGPRVVVPGRAYLLFRGPLADAGDWGAAELWPGQARFDMPGPAFAWPADHAWCVASDVDPHWAGIGADKPVIDQLIADPRLDVVPADPGQEQPAYR
jgi:hypothetical protein